MRGSASALALAAALLAGGAAAAPVANPELVARDYGDAARESAALKIARLDVEVELVGGLARTTVTARFENPTDDDLEGDFVLDLPTGSVVTGYALDVDGTMVDGVLVGRRQGTQAYEEKVRQGVDPGLAEVTREGAFRTRVYPVMPKQGRTVRVSFVTALAPDAPYVLPLAGGAPVGATSVTVRADRTEAPKLVGPEGLDLRWIRAGDGWEAKAEATGRKLDGALRIDWAPPPRPLVSSRHAHGERFFELDDVAPVRAPRAARAGRVRLYWDRSRSRRDDDLKGEIALVRRWLETTRPTTVDLVAYADRGPELRSITGADLPGQVERALQAVDYRGATSLAGVAEVAAARADACLWVSDGTVSIDAYELKRTGCPLFTVSSAPDADHGLLTALARRSGGEHVDLHTTSADAALARLTERGPRIAGVADASGQELDFIALPTAAGRFRIVGRAPAGGELDVELADGGVRRYALGRSVAHDGAGALWGAARVGELAAASRSDPKKVLAAARRYSVAGLDAVFVVLESVDDYAEADIAPPESASKTVKAEWRELVADREAGERKARAQRLDAVAEAWAEQKIWWGTTFKPVKVRKPEEDRRPAGAADAAAAAAPARLQARLAPSSPPPPSPVDAPDAAAAPADAGALTGGYSDGGVEEVVVTGARRRSGEPEEAVIAVKVEAWNPDRPYLKALAAAAPSDFDTVFRAQEAEHGELPAFYLDVAEWLFRQGRREEAVAVALNALELPTADTTTLTILADRLARYGATERALWLYEKILALEPDRPQPRRNLALALIDRAERPGAIRPAADYARAIDLLWEVVSTPWDGDYDGVELIALMEANRAAAKLKALGGGADPIDPRLRALLDVDLRVVLEWNTDKTDMDLWVDEPSGERAIYSQPKTAIGGRLSNDMTRGYGPEEYLLRRAMTGTYQVRVDTYAADRLNPNGATTVRARLYRNWGRPDETVESLEIELAPDGEDGQLVGEFKAGK